MARHSIFGTVPDSMANVEYVIVEYVTKFSHHKKTFF